MRITIHCDIPDVIQWMTIKISWQSKVKESGCQSQYRAGHFWTITSKSSVKSKKTPYRYDLRFPRIQRERSDFRDVNTQTPMDAAAFYAQHNPQINTGPSSLYHKENHFAFTTMQHHNRDKWINTLLLAISATRVSRNLHYFFKYACFRGGFHFLGWVE